MEEDFENITNEPTALNANDVSNRQASQDEAVSDAEYDSMMESYADSDEARKQKEIDDEENRAPYVKLGEEVEAELAKPEEPAEEPKFDINTPEGKKEMAALELSAKQNAEMLPRIILGGIGDVAEGTVNTAIDIMNWTESKLGLDLVPDDMKLDVMKRLIPPNDNGVESFARGATTFITGFGTLNKLAKGWKTAGKLSTLSKGASIGFMADITVFDPDEKNLSQFIQDVPELQNPITEFLASSDSRAEKRLKNGLEGLLMGAATTVAVNSPAKIKALTETLFGQVKFYKNVRAFNKAIAKSKIAKTLDTPMAKLETESIKEEAVRLTTVIEKDKSISTLKAVREVTDKLKERGLKVPRKLSAPLPKEKTLEVMRELVSGKFPGTMMAKGTSLKGFNRPEDVRNAIKLAAEAGSEKIVILRDGKRKIAASNKLAEKATEFDVETMLALPDNAVLPEEHMIRARVFVEQQAMNIMELANKASRGEIAFTDVQEAMDLFTDLTVKWVNVGTEQARGLQVRGQTKAGIGVYTPEMAADLAENMTEENIGSYLKHLGSIGFGADEVVDAAQRSIYMRWYDAILEARIGAMLWSPTTNTKNIVSNTAMTVSAPMETQLAEAIGYITRGDPMTGAAKAQVTGTINSMIDGLRLASKTLKERTKHLRGAADGLPTVSGSAGKMESFGQRAISGDMLGFADANSELGKAAGKFFDVAGDVVNLSGSVLVSTDEFFKTINARGFTNKMWAEKSQELRALGRTAEQIDSYYNSWIKRPSVKKKAAEFSKYNTLTNPIPEGTISSNIEKLVRATPFDRVTMPFLRVNLNSARFAVERIPGLAMILPEVSAAIRAGGKQADMAIARQAFGGGIMAIGGSLAYAGLTTGSGPGNKDAFKMWREIGGMQPYSIKVGKTWYPMNMAGPLGDIIGLAADISSLATYDGEGHEYSPNDIASAAALAIGNVYTPEFMTETIGEVLDIVMRGDEGAMDDFIAQQPALFIPNVVKRLRRVADPNKRVTYGPGLSVFDKIIKNVQNSIPGLSTQLDMKVNRLGQPLLYPLGWTDNMIIPSMTSVSNPGHVNRELMELGMFSPLVSPKTPKDTVKNVLDVDIKIGGLPKFITYGLVDIVLSTSEQLKFEQLAAGIGLNGKPPIQEELGRVMANGWNNEEYNSIKDSVGKIQAKKMIVSEIFKAYEKAATGQMLEEVLVDKMSEHDKQMMQQPKMK